MNRCRSSQIPQGPSKASFNPVRAERGPAHFLSAALKKPPYSVDDLKDTIYSRTGLLRSSFWLGTQAQLRPPPNS